MIIDESEYDLYLEHYGVPGMKWGVRKDRDGVSRKVDRDAKKDAQEFARAKMFYGTGAGNRRKLIKATVESKKKKDSSYAKAFDKHLGSQDMSKHASKAKGERKGSDRKLKAKQRTGFVARQITGEMGTQAAFTAAALGGAAYLNSPKGRATVNKTVKQAASVAENYKRSQGAKHINDFLKKNM